MDVAVVSPILGKGAEIVIQRAILLRQENNVIDSALEGKSKC
jgi:hypothetical protein